MAETPKITTCGLIMPIAGIDGCSSEHWEEVRNIIREALPSSEYKVELVSDSNEVGIIQNRIVNNIYKSDIVICDVSGKNPNVMFELGMRLAFDKPTVIIKDDKTNYSFDTANIEHINYPRALHYQSIVEFKNLLQKKVKATYEASLDPEYTTFLKHFGEFKVANVSEKEISSEKYILKAIDDLSLSVQRMESRKHVEDTTSNKFHITSHEIDRTFTNAFREYMNRYDMPEVELLQHKKQLESMVTSELMEYYNMPRSFALKIVSKHMDTKLNQFMPF